MSNSVRRPEPGPGLDFGVSGWERHLRKLKSDLSFLGVNERFSGVFGRSFDRQTGLLRSGEKPESSIQSEV